MNLATNPNGEPVRTMPEPGIVVSAATPAPSSRIIATARTGMSAASATAPMNPRTILRALRRRSALALGVAMLLSGTCGPAAWFLVPPGKFKAQAQLQVVAKPPKVLFRTIETEAISGEEYKRYQSTQQTLVKSQMVLTAALQDPKLGNYAMIRDQVEPVAWLQDKLVVGFLSGSEVMEISLSGNDPVEVAGIVNAVKKAYMEEVVNVDFKRRADRHAMLRKAKERYATFLKERRATLRKLAETVGSDDRQTLALRQQFAIEHVAEIRKELREVQSRKRKLGAQLKMIRPQDADIETPAPEITESDIRRVVDQDPSVRRLLDKLAEQEEQFSSKMAHLHRVARNATSDPLKVRLGGEIEASRRSLEDRRKALRPVAIQALQEEGLSDKTSRGGEFEQELAVLAQLERELEAEVKSVSAVNQSLTVNTLDLQEMQDEVVQLKEIADKVSSEVEAINVELEAPPRIRLIDEASIPQTRDENKRYLIIGMIIAGSFFAGLLGVAFLELQDRKVDSADEVPNELGLTVVGALPVLPLRVHRRGPIARRETEKDRYWRNLLLESVDATRTMLVHAARNGSHRVVMITSAVSGEGKTSLASSLATSLARSGLHTLLIDADLRSPSINQLFNLPVAPGLSELLRGEVDADGAIAATTVKGLHLMAAGRCDRQTVRILAQGCLGPILAGLKERFDFVIVDSSPILPVADASIIAQDVDAVLISIFGEVSRKAKILAAIQRLRDLGVPILGAVVTGDTGGLYGGYYSGSQVYYPMLPDSAGDTSDAISGGTP